MPKDGEVDERILAHRETSWNPFKRLSARLTRGAQVTRKAARRSTRR